MKKTFSLYFVLLVLISILVGCATMDAEAYKNRGNQFLEQKDYDRALAQYNKALKIDPNYPNAIINIGVVYVNQGKYDDGMKQYNRAIEIGSEDSRVMSVMYENRSRLYYYVYKKYNLALQDCETALRLNQNSTSAINFSETMNSALRRFKDVNEAITAFISEYPDLWKNYIGYHVDNGRNGETVIYIEQPNVNEEIEAPQDTNQVRPLRELSLSLSLSPDVPQVFQINETLENCYFKFSDIGDAIEITREFYDAYLQYLGDKRPTSAQIQTIKARARQQEQERNRPKYTRIFEVLESAVPGQNYKTWIINTRDLMVSEILKSNLADNIINNYYSHTFTGDGRVLSRDLLYKMTISSLGGDRYNRIINTAVQYLSMDGYYDTDSYQAAAQMIGILIIKELCRVKLSS
jgi:tetratricopeptide (TPR) repeat protein